jgi:hypothetical protein
MENSRSNQGKTELVLAAALVVVAVSTRFLFNYLEIFNFNAVMAAAFFGGAYLSKNRFSMMIPLVAMVLSDLVIGFDNVASRLTVYSALTLTIVYGRYYAEKKNLLRYVLAVLGGSLTFFILTNGGLWAFGELYPRTLEGFIQCYTMGIPFWRSTLVGDFVFATLLTGSFELMRIRKTQDSLATRAVSA